MVRLLAMAMLERAGYTVLTATTGHEAVAVFEQHAGDIDMVLLDVVMPGLGGREAFERMRVERPGLKALFASGYSADAVHTDYVLDEGVALIQKPFRRADLLCAVRAVLDAGN
jgi:CheY-like chemotaxis protein